MLLAHQLLPSTLILAPAIKQLIWRLAEFSCLAPADPALKHRAEGMANNEAGQHCFTALLLKQSSAEAEVAGPELPREPDRVELPQVAMPKNIHRSSCSFVSTQETLNERLAALKAARAAAKAHSIACLRRLLCPSRYRLSSSARW